MSDSDKKFLDNVAWIILIVVFLISVGLGVISALSTSISFQGDFAIAAFFTLMIGALIAEYVSSLDLIINYKK